LSYLSIHLSRDRISLCNWGWPWTCDPLASVSWVLELQVCTTTSDYFIF
jgi:hypothetical protein